MGYYTLVSVNVTMPHMTLFDQEGADLDVYRSANELIEQHGEDAPIHAAMRADELMEAGDMEGVAVWKRIVKAIEELLSEERPDDAEVH